MFQGIHDGRPNAPLLSYHYLQMLPRRAQGEANKVLGTAFGATFLGAISHLLIIALAVVGAGALALAGRPSSIGAVAPKGPHRPAGG